MKKGNVVIGIALMVILILGYLVFRMNSQISDLENEKSLITIKTDTVFKDKYITIKEPLENKQNAKRVVIYKKDTVHIPYKELVYLNNNLVLYNNVEDSLKINKYFLLQYPRAEKLIAFDLSTNDLELSLLGIDGLPKRLQYGIDLNKYNYRYTDNQLTFKRKSLLKLLPQVSYSYRPLNNLHDLDISVGLKTTRFIYNLGLSSFYYPTVWDKPKLDLKFNVTYNF